MEDRTRHGCKSTRKRKLLTFVYAVRFMSGVKNSKSEIGNPQYYVSVVRSVVTDNSYLFGRVSAALGDIKFTQALFTSRSQKLRVLEFLVSFLGKFLCNANLKARV